MPELSIDDYSKLVVRSHLVSDDVVMLVYQEFLGAENTPNATAADLAKFFESKDLLTDWQNQKLLQGRYKGFVLGKYKFLKKLGAGGMGAVYLGKHTVMDRLAAIKVLPKVRVDQKSYLERFKLEARALAQLDHKNIVKVYDVDNLGDLHYIVMEYVPGKDLEQFVRSKGPLTDLKAANFVGQAVRGLHHAHHRKLVHRDIKPSNLLLDTSKTIKLLDLGLARLTNDDASLTTDHDEKMLGTADYLAPEQALDCHGADARADIYSLGCTLYFLLTGHPPFNKGTVAQRLLSHQSQSPVAIDQERKRLKLAPVDQGLINICNKMMAKKPADRFQSAKEVYTAILDWLEATRGNKKAGDSTMASMSALDAAPTEPAASPALQPTYDDPTCDLATITEVEPVTDVPLSTVDTDASQVDFATMVDPGSSAIPSDVWSQSSIYSGSMLQQTNPLEQQAQMPIQQMPVQPAPFQPLTMQPAAKQCARGWIWIASAVGGLLFVVGLIVMIAILWNSGDDHSNPQTDSAANTSDDTKNVATTDDNKPAQIAVAGQLVVHLDAKRAIPDQGKWPNQGTALGPFNVKPASTFVVEPYGPNQNRAVRIDQNYFIGPNAPGMVCGGKPRSIEVWVFNREAGEREPMVAWGRKGKDFKKDFGLNVAFNYGSHERRGAAEHFGNTAIPWYRADSIKENEKPVPEIDVWHYLAYTYDGTTEQGGTELLRVYIDGVETNSRKMKLRTIGDASFLLGTQPSPPDAKRVVSTERASLALAIVRIHSKALTPHEIIQNYTEESPRFGRKLNESSN